ncbi:MAG TPA: hypothetical protein VLL52_21045 [Anaerolineae bacterium]|nr:hypothetical protein [Anaerolineae bacterium]
MAQIDIELALAEGIINRAKAWLSMWQKLEPEDPELLRLTAKVMKKSRY